MACTLYFISILNIFEQSLSLTGHIIVLKTGFSPNPADKMCILNFTFHFRMVQRHKKSHFKLCVESTHFQYCKKLNYIMERLIV